MTERGTPFDAQRRLLGIGVSQQEIATIRRITRAERDNRIWAAREGIDMGGHDFLLGIGGSGLFSGDYQTRLQDNLGFPQPFLEIPTETPIRKGFPLHRRTE